MRPPAPCSSFRRARATQQRPGRRATRFVRTDGPSKGHAGSIRRTRRQGVFSCHNVPTIQTGWRNFGNKYILSPPKWSQVLSPRKRLTKAKGYQNAKASRLGAAPQQPSMALKPHTRPPLGPKIQRNSLAFQLNFFHCALQLASERSTSNVLFLVPLTVGR